MLKIEIIGVLFLTIFLTQIVKSQGTEPTINDIAAARAASDRERQIKMDNMKSQEDGINRLKAISEGRYSHDTELVHNKKIVRIKYSPKYGEDDIRAIAIPDEDLKTYSIFLKGSKVGIRRLQNSATCPSSDLVINASGGCPNSVAGKATAFSFRTDNYRSPVFADLFYDGNKLKTPGLFILGILSDLGNADINHIDSATAGVKELLKFEPSARQVEVERDVSILKIGLQIGDYTYSTEVEAVVGNVYVIRSIAYKGISSVRGRKQEIGTFDERKDVTFVFKIVRQMSDGSIVLVWKEISRISSPKVTLEAR